MFKRLLFWSKKKPLKPLEKKREEPDLKDYRAIDPEACEALYDTIFLDPGKLGISMKEAAKGRYFEIAGGLAIYEGNVKKVKEYFGKYAKLSGEKLKILEIPERAVKLAQQYYKDCQEYLNDLRKEG